MNRPAGGAGDSAGRVFANLERRPSALPLLLSALSLACILAGNETLDGHEALVAETAREMVANGDWLVPTFLGEPRLLKPPLAYWTTAISIRLFGVSETAARLPSALAMLALTTGVVWFAGRALSPRAGLIAGCVHATTFWPLAYGTSALVDGTLAALVAWCVFLGARDHVGDRSPTSWAQALAFWVLLALAALAKGPIGPCLALPPVMAFRWMHRGAGMRFFWRPATLVGLPLALGLSLAWPLAILQAHPEAMEIWTAQSVGRFAERFGEQTRPWYYYGYAIFGLALPWLPLALASTFRCPADETSKGTRQVLWLWFGWAFLFCSLSAGKRAHYLLPGLAPLSV
ncbi:MAG TPA: glycosyltransferase family 39 protein, partial [Planctomycetia bacterium]|nr:glycosyltransferase family 39 protein [Planctomycetia bacterium]